MAIVPIFGQNLKPFAGNGDVSIWLKNSRVGRKTQNKQTNTQKKTPNERTNERTNKQTEQTNKQTNICWK